VVVDEVTLLVGKVAASFLVGTGLMVAQAVAEDPVSTWVGVGGQAVAWSVVAYFSRALLTGQMVVRSQADDKAKWEAAQQRWESAAAELREALAESHLREGQLHDLVSEFRRTQGPPRA
jgi:hypothetical protein